MLAAGSKKRQLPRPSVFVTRRDYTVSIRKCISLAGSLLYKNWQRPGAIVNATMDEFDHAKVVRDSSDAVFVMKVVNHKTAAEGSANVVMEKSDRARISLYVDTHCKNEGVTVTPKRGVKRLCE